ncbi:MAG: helix-turn-helix transcriptional regulator [Desulfobacterales bacterium]
MSNLAAPWILLTLSNHEGTHGYEIKKIIKGYMQDLNIGLNITGLYRHLNILEKRGMLISKWDVQNKGPAKRKYYLTAAGKECLWHWMQTLSIQVLLIDRFFEKAKSAFPSATLPKIQF